MPKLKPATQRARREHILDAAEMCFARQGFHRTTMQDICKEALISPGALYVYFASKEDLIAGIAERDRAEFAERFAESRPAPDLLAALASSASTTSSRSRPTSGRWCIEIGLESTRNPKVGEILPLGRPLRASRASRSCSIAPAPRGASRPSSISRCSPRSFATIGDGMFLRRAVDPDLDAGPMIATFLDIVAKLLNPTQPLSLRTKAPNHSKAPV